MEDWDSSAEIRRRMRSSKKLFVKEDGKDKPKANIPCAALNYDVLKPLVERLEESPGVLGMHPIPDLMRQTLDSIIQLCDCCPPRHISLTALFECISHQIQSGVF